MVIALAVLTTASILVNAFLFYKITKKPVMSDQKTYDATALIRDLTAYGNAVVRLERIDPADILIKTPRDI